jgi:outer membrane protein OmpA-like peptidoglycan-associated protein
MTLDQTIRLGTLTAVGALALSGAGCGHAAITPQLAAARAVMQEARSGAAAQLEPDELLVAQRTLSLAEGQADGSFRESHYAYIAERQTRVAMADARRAQIEQGVARDEQAYQLELERVARERGVALESTTRALAEREQTLQEQQSTLAAREAELAREQEARQHAEANAADAMARVRELASVRQDAHETVITLSGEVLFETDRAVLRPEAQSRLLAVADALRSSPEQSAVIAGYTDSRGSDSYNQELSQRRAESVRDYLLGEGVPVDRVRAEGRGEASPIASNDSPEGRANNRRVEIILRPTPAH